MAECSNKGPRNLPSCFFILFFTVSVTPAVNTLKTSNYVIILIILFISSFDINKVYPFPALAVPFSLLFLSDWLITWS